MEAVKSWAVAVCFAAIAAAVAQMLFPEGNLKKVFQIAVSAFFLCCFISPLLSIGSSLELSLPESKAAARSTAEILESEMERQMKAQIEAQLKILIKEAMEETGVDAQKIIIQMDTGEDGGIVMKQIDIVLRQKDAEKGLDVKRAVQSALGDDCPLEVKTG